MNKTHRANPRLRALTRLLRALDRYVARMDAHMLGRRDRSSMEVIAERLPDGVSIDDFLAELVRTVQTRGA